MSLADMDQDKHTTMTMHTMYNEYTPIAVALSAYSHYKVKSTHDHERVALLTMGVHHTKCMTIHRHAYIYHAQCKHTAGK